MVPSLLAGLGTVAVLTAPLGYRSGLLPLGPAFIVLLVGMLASGLALLLAAVGLVRGTQPLGLWPVSSLVAAAVTLAVPLAAIAGGMGRPAIHDISTDLADPPRFVAVVPLRGDAANPLDARGPELAAMQAGAYPDLSSLRLPGSSVEDVTSRAASVARELGWEVVDVDPAAGRVEATDSTSWFGFKDDIVVRVQPSGSETRVDVRSVSRVGQGDLGSNAARIATFLDRLSQSSS